MTDLTDSAVQELLHMEGRAQVGVEAHRPEPRGMGCTCGFCSWSAEHVVAMVHREVYEPAFHAAVQAEVERRVGAVKPKVHARTCFPYEVTYIAGDGSQVRGPRYGSRENAENAATAVKARLGYAEAVIDKHPCTCGEKPADD